MISAIRRFTGPHPTALAQRKETYVSSEYYFIDDIKNDYMSTLHLEVRDYQRGQKSRRVSRLSRDEGGTPVEIFHEFDRIVPFSQDTLLDGHVLAILLFAASNVGTLRVHGAMSRKALRNMHEMLLAWSRWKPERYRQIEIVSDRIVDVRRPVTEERAIAAFSGGVDASFTALRHAVSLQSASDSTRYPLQSLLMVHGFDVDVYNFDDFNRLTARVRPLVDALQLDFRAVRTNSRDLRLQDWDDSSALELAACMHMQADDFQYGLIGSTKSYDTLVLPWGSNPVTDHLMSGGGFEIVRDGAGFTRTDKVAGIMRYPLACRTLKVCWAGPDQAENCGRCRKFVRTQLNFLAAGASTPPACFPGDLDIERIEAITITNVAQAVEFSSLLVAAAANKVAGPWLPIVQDRVATWRPADAVPENLTDIMKRSIARALIAAGAEKPAKKVWRSARRGVLKWLSQLAGLARREAPAFGLPQPGQMPSCKVADV